MKGRDGNANQANLAFRITKLPQGRLCLAAQGGRSSETIKLQILLIRDNIIVEKEAGYVFITVKYMVPISLPRGEFNWNFECTANN